MTTKLLNTKNTRKFILAKTASMRPGWNCTRVSAQAIDVIEAKVRAMIVKMVETHPTIGKTFQQN